MANRQQRLIEQLEDLRAIQSAFNQRDSELDAEIDVTFDFNSAVLREWRYYKTIKLKLNAEQKQIEEKLQNVGKQLEALQKMAIFVNNNHTMLNHKTEFLVPSVST